MELQEFKSALFDPTEFAQTISQGPAIKAYKDCIQQAQEKLYEAFRGTLDAEKLVHARSWFMDQLLSFAWNQYSWSEAEDISLLAVGGYGRGELHPHSDIDLLILLENEQAFDNHKDNMQDFITLLWDMKLDVGHSVRTIEECAAEGEKDLTIATNLMETRVLTGSPTLRQDMLQLTAPSKIWSSQEFFSGKWQEQKERHNKYQDTQYNLEPNIKGSPGGLRDIHMISWVTQRHFGQDGLKALVSHDFLSESEYGILQKCRDFLWKVRFALHMVAGREEDQLLFNLQREVACVLGYCDSDERLAVEQFMHQYYRTSLAMNELNDVLLQQFNEEILQKDQQDKITPINERFQLVNQYLDITSDDVFKKSSCAMMEAFVLLQKDENIQGVRARTIKALRDHRHLIDNKFRRNPQNNKMFMQIISSPRFVVRELERMMRYGILGKYIPHFGNIIGQMQHDLFHMHTVDMHTFQCILLLRQIRNGVATEKFPLASKIIHKHCKKEVLYLAALLHDLGKGVPGDHCETGALMAERFCVQHDISQVDTRLICWLIRQHLLLSHTQQREDLADPETIQQFAHRVKDQKHLDHLYVLTVADIYGTNPKLWSSWRAEKLREVYHQAQRLLRRGLENPVDKDAWIAQNQAIAVNQLKEKGYSEEEVFTLWGSPGDDYFLREDPKDVVWHTLAIAKHGDNPEPLVLIQETSEIKYEGATQIFICTQDKPQLFAAATAALDQLNLSIQDARIMTSNNHYSLDTFIVLEEDGDSIGNNPKRISQIQQHLIKALDNPEDFPNIIQRRTPRALKHFNLPTEVTISNDLSNQRTIVEVITPDRPGLLARIGAIFARYNVVLQNARILTLGERVEDIFFITNANDSPISDPDLCLELQQALCRELDEQAEAQANI